MIFATGYRPNISSLSGTGAFASDSRPLHVAGVSTEVPGLYYVGLSNQRSFASATVRGVGADAKYIVRNIKRFLKNDEYPFEPQRRPLELLQYRRL